jgi:hypothetical protein
VIGSSRTRPNLVRVVPARWPAHVLLLNPSLILLPGKPISTERQMDVAVDIAEHVAGKKALKAAALKLADRLVPALVRWQAMSLRHLMPVLRHTAPLLRRLASIFICLFSYQAVAEEKAAVRLAIAPIGWEFFDGQEALGESLTPVLLAALSDDPRWTMVERAQLAAIEAEWALNQPGVSDASASVVRGRLLGADWILVLRPDASLERPALHVEIVDALRAEPMAVREANLRLRPRARWFRNPPAEDLAAVVAAARQALDDAYSARANRAGRRAAALLFVHPEEAGPAADASRSVEQALADALAIEDRPEGWRLLGSLQPDAPRGEGLLRVSGFVDERACVPASAIADAFLWGRLEAAGDNTLRLKFWLWTGSGQVKAHVAEGDAVMIAASMCRVLLSLPPRPAISAVEPVPAPEAGRHQLARELVAEARTLSAIITPHPGSGSPSITTRLLELAAFLEPLDREIQELRIHSSLRDLPENVFGERDHPAQADAQRRRISLGLDYIRLADHFWRLPDDRYDLRLLEASFIYSPRETPGYRAFAARATPFVARMPLAELEHRQNLLERWLHCARIPDEDSFTILEVALPLFARFRPDRMETPPDGGLTGWIPTFIEAYPDDQTVQIRLRSILERLPRGKTADDPLAAYRLAPSAVKNSPPPELPTPPPSRTGR